jgi:PilZ domain
MPEPSSTSRKAASTRRFPRYLIDTRIQASVFREGGAEIFWGRSREIGEDGIGATLSGQLNPGEIVTMGICVPGSAHIVQVRAAVRYSQGFYCGFEFLVLTEEQRDIVRRLCERLGKLSGTV